MSISFHVTPAERELLSDIADHAVRMAKKAGVEYDKMTAVMDLTARHANGNPLKLSELLDADDFNFSHDVFGIARHINRETGKLGGQFLPRFSQR